MYNLCFFGCFLGLAAFICCGKGFSKPKANILINNAHTLSLAAREDDVFSLRIYCQYIEHMKKKMV